MLDRVAVHSSFDHIRPLAHVNPISGKITCSNIIIFLLRILILIIGKFYFVPAKDRIPRPVERRIPLKLPLLEKRERCIRFKLFKKYRILLITVLYKRKKGLSIIKLIFSTGISVISAGLVITLVEIVASAGLIDRKEQKIIRKSAFI